MTRARTRAAASALVVASLASGAFGCRVARLGDASESDASAPSADSGEGGVAGVDAAPPVDEALPSGGDDELAARARHLLEAVARDDPELAADIVFPREGWMLTHDGSDPGKEWSKRVANPFRRGIHALSRSHRGIQDARFVSFSLGHAMSQETPRRHGWSKPLWTIHHSTLTYEVDGRTHTLSIREMVAWRGAWYVTRFR